MGVSLQGNSGAVSWQMAGSGTYTSHSSVTCLTEFRGQFLLYKRGAKKSRERGGRKYWMVE